MKRSLSILPLLALAACHSAQPPAAPAAGARVDEKSVVGSYEGTLPCADCDGIRTRLGLMPGYRYQLQETYLGKSTLVFNDHGRWSLNPRNAHIDLFSNRRSYVVHFRGVSSDELQALDRAGNDIADARANLSLKRAR